MPKPERILLQEKAWPKHATLANGVKCGEEAAFPVSGREYITGWREYISFSGRVMEGMSPSEAPGSDPDGIFRWPEQAARKGQRILGLMTNAVMPDLVRLVLDVGDDPSQPGQLECETVLASARDLDPELIEQLVFLRMLPMDYEQ